MQQHQHVSGEHKGMAGIQGRHQADMQTNNLPMRGAAAIMREGVSRGRRSQRAACHPKSEANPTLGTPSPAPSSFCHHESGPE
jgi:hypothetical protein